MSIKRNLINKASGIIMDPAPLGIPIIVKSVILLGVWIYAKVSKKSGKEKQPE